MGEHYLDTVVVDGSIPSAPTINFKNQYGGRNIAQQRRRKLVKEEKTRVNEAIKSPKVRLIDDEGGQLGIVAVEDAIEMAEDKGLDLVEVSGKSDPPVCRIMDYGKFKYQQSKKQHDAKKKQAVIRIKEIKLRPKTEEHDFQFKLKHAIGFLKDGNKVKVTLQYRGRELAFTHMGIELLERFASEADEIGEVESKPRAEGRTTFMILAPKKKEK